MEEKDTREMQKIPCMDAIKGTWMPPRFHWCDDNASLPTIHSHKFTLFSEEKDEQLWMLAILYVEVFEWSCCGGSVKATGTGELVYGGFELSLEFML